MKRLRELFAVVLIFDHTIALASPTFPDLSVQQYCSNFVSKIIDKQEKERELADCKSEESSLRDKLKPFWDNSSEDLREKILQHLKKDGVDTYYKVYKYLAQEFGAECLAGKTQCSANKHNP